MTRIRQLTPRDYHAHGDIMEADTPEEDCHGRGYSH